MLRDITKGEREPDVVGSKQLGGADIVHDERGDDAERTTRLCAPCSSRRHKFGYQNLAHQQVPHGKAGPGLPMLSIMNIRVRKKNRAIKPTLVLREATLMRVVC